MSRHILLAGAAAALLATLAACTEDDTSDYTNPHLKGFYFADCDRAENIDDAYFTVDTVNLLVYNEDSIDYGVDLTRLLPVTSYYQRVYSIAFNGEVWNETDSLDFTRMNEITLVSGNRERTVTYRLDVRQHRVNPDSTAWSLRSSVHFPFTPTAFGLVTDGGRLFLLASDGEAGGAVASSADGVAWTLVNEFSMNADVRTALLADGKITMLSASGDESLTLSTGSPSEGWSAQPVSAPLTDLLGAIGSFVYATDGSKIYRSDGVRWEEAPLSAPLPDGFPARRSAKVSFKNRIFLYGGTDADDNALGGAFSTMDGAYWASILNGSGYRFGTRTGASAVYYLRRVFLIGGESETTGFPTKRVSVSLDEGFSWNRAEHDLYLPESYAARQGSGAVEFRNSVWIAGGFFADGTATTDVWEGRMNRADFIIQ